MEKPNHERKSRGFREKLQQSAKNITSRERKAKSPKTPAQKRATRRKVWGVIGTICLVGVLTIAIFVGIFMYYVNKTMKGSIEVPMSEYKPAVSTEMYYDKNAGTGEKEDWYMYQTLYYEQNRIWVDLGQIPDYLQQAAIAIEDKRFESHHGVDWYGTMRAIVRTLTGGSMQGGSTITQQTIKNITGDNQDNVKRKIMEIYRALALEKEYSKDDILEVYLNTIYLGEMCYGVQTASQAYFGKDAADLTLAESACLIGITNNPSMYDPLLSDWTRENNRDRQLTILKAMLDQNKISSEEYEAAKNEEVVFTNGYTCLGNYVEDHPEALSPEEQEKVSLEVRENLLDFYFKLSHFLDIYERQDENYVKYTRLCEDGSFELKLFCVNPRENLKECMLRGRRTILFSATFLPIQYYKNLLGGEKEDYEVYAHSVFDPEKRTILIAGDVTSKFSRRSQEEYYNIARYIHEVVKNRHGNYMIFFPSYSFMNHVYEIYEQYFMTEEEECLVQQESMNEEEREYFLNRFRGNEECDLQSLIGMEIEEEEEQTLIGFCVLGGIFGEGIDLKRDSLIGVIVVGTGLPQVGCEREILKGYFDEDGENGFDYSYRYPGMNKVLQAAGRVIRTAEDVGIIVLLDDRFQQYSYRRLFPREWEQVQPVTVDTVAKKVERFWDAWLWQKG